MESAQEGRNLIDERSDPEMADEAAILARLRTVTSDAKRAAQQWKKLAMIAGRFADQTDVRDLAAVVKAATELEKLDKPDDQISRRSDFCRSGIFPSHSKELAAALRAFAERERRARRFRIGKEVVGACASIGLEARGIGRDPPTLAVGAVLVALDHAASRAVVTYARQRVAEAPLVATEVAAAAAKAIAALEGRSRPPDEFRQILLAAYRAHLARTGRADHARVEVVDLLPEVAVAMQAERFRTDPRAKLFRDYSRAQLAFDLQRLIDAGGISKGGLRLDLGPATMGATANKSRVLWLETAPETGQYYGSLRFVPEPPEPPERCRSPG